MKNKDKYDLRVLDIKVDFLINGCGKKIVDTRTISIYDGKRLIKKEKTQKELIKYIMEWLESD